MRLEILLTLWLVTTLCTGHAVPHASSTPVEPGQQAAGGAQQEVDRDQEASALPSAPGKAEVPNLSKPSEDDELETDPEQPASDPSEPETEPETDEDDDDDDDDMPDHTFTGMELDKRGPDMGADYGYDYGHDYDYMGRHQPSAIMCTDWIDKFFTLLCLGEENRNAKYADFQRIFLAMDNTGSATVNVSLPEFVVDWKRLAGFGIQDSQFLFANYFAVLGDPGDAKHINEMDVEMVWQLLFAADPNLGLSKEDFTSTWEYIILPSLPHHGCRGVAEVKDDYAYEFLQGPQHVRHDVYGYFRKKKK